MFVRRAGSRQRMKFHSGPGSGPQRPGTEGRPCRQQHLEVLPIASEVTRDLHLTLT